MSESSGLPPEQEAVRRLLADARHTAPPPPEVVARLEDTLATLVSQRAAEPTAGSTAERDARDDRSPGRVVDLGSRRRRMAGIGLLAAASVVVAGVAIGQALPRGDDASSAGSQSDSSPAEAGDAGASSAESDASTDSGSGSGSDSGAGSEPTPESLKSSPATTGGLPSLSTADADLDAQLLVLREDAAGRREAAALDALSGCDIPRPGRSASAVPAEIDGQVGVVVFRRPVEEAQVVELFVCGLAAPARTITLPAP